MRAARQVTYSRSQNYLAILSRPMDPQAVMEAEGNARMFTPNQLLPDQLTPSKPDHAERRLAVAMLETVADDLEKFQHNADPRGRRLYTEALAYVMNGDVRWPFSFVRLCHALDLDVSWVRRLLLRKYRRLDG